MKKITELRLIYIKLVKHFKEVKLIIINKN